jgi:hypothetical protein
VLLLHANEVLEVFLELRVLLVDLGHILVLVDLVLGDQELSLAHLDLCNVLFIQVEELLVLLDNLLFRLLFLTSFLHEFDLLCQESGNASFQFFSGSHVHIG